MCKIRNVCLTRKLSFFCNYRTNNFLAVGTEDGEIYIWQTADFTLYKKYQIHPSSIATIRYSPDSLKLAFGGKNKTLQIIDAHTGMSVFSHNTKSDICCLKWKDFLLVVGCDDGRLFIWDIAEVKILHEITAHSSKI